MRKLFVIAAFFTSYCCQAQAPATDFTPAYHFLASDNQVQDKVFYFFTLLQQLPAVNACIANNMVLKEFTQDRIQSFEKAATLCKDSTLCYTDALVWSEEKIRTMQTALLAALTADEPAMKELATHMRQCGYFQLYQSLDDKALIAHAWQDAAAGLNHIVAAYLFNKDLPYPKIDSASYDVTSKYYRGLFYEIMLTLTRYKMASQHLFFQPSLLIAVQLLATNNRDEAVRYEPFSTLDTTLATTVANTNWHNYAYSAIVVLGEGPEYDNIPISPYGKLRCMAAAANYQQGKAPFIIVSGGHVHPFQTKYSEAIEMRRFLIEACHIPAGAILTDPYARHTTTNFRNANRILFRNGFPVNQPILCITSKAHADYIMDSKFPKRCLVEIKHLPFVHLERLNDFELVYTPVQSSLQANTMEPLDP